MGGSKRVPHWWDLSGSFRTNPTPERRLIFNRHAAIKVKTHAKIKAECGSQQGMAWAFFPGFSFYGFPPRSLSLPVSPFQTAPFQQNCGGQLLDAILEK